MTSFHTSLSRLRRLVLLQRSVRLTIRLIWLATGGYLLAVSLDALFGWFPDESTRLVVAGLFGSPVLVGLLRPLNPERLAWRADRNLQLHEQLTAAWRVGLKVKPNHPVESALLEDSTQQATQVYPRVRKLGWHLRPDLEALMIVALLAGATFFSHQAGTQITLEPLRAFELPALDPPPQFEDVFPSGIPGLTDGSPGTSNSTPATGGGQGEEQDLREISNILYDLGEALTEHPETAEAGEALQSGDLENAAAAIERTADQVDLLPEDARQNLQQALQQAAQQAQSSGQDDLAEDLQAAAQALENPDPNNPMAADALDQLADGLRELGEVFASMGDPNSDSTDPTPENPPQVGSAGGAGGSGSGSGMDGQSEPLSRLEGEGEEFSLEGGDTPSGLLAPGSSPSSVVVNSAGPSPTGSGETGGPATIVNSILTPYTFPWKWRDVVSEYFSP